MQVAAMGTCMHAVRVESAANLADGPTRENLIELERLGAKFVPPVLPDWVYRIWEWP